MIGGPFQQPVAQFAGGAAVVAVVVLDVGEHRGGGVGVAGGGQFAVLVVHDDRVRRGGDIAGPQFVAHVERFEVFEAVAARPDANPVAHHGVEIHQDAAPQQVVDLLLADAVVAGEFQQRGPLVVGVVVDVHVGVLRSAFPDQVEKAAQGCAFSDAVMGPDRGERPVGAEHPEEVFQPPLPAVGSPERVSLEVEEDVTGAERRKPGQRLGPDDLVGRHTAG